MVAKEPYLDRDMSPRFLPEVWAWFGIGCLIMALRYAVRLRTVGLRGLQGDDYIMAFAFVLYLLDAILVTLIFVYGANVDVPPSDPYSLSDGQVKSLEAGSRAQFAAWYTYTAMIWCMKFCMLFFYKRLTFGTMQHRTVNWLMWVCGVTYIAVLLTISLSCQPYWHNWQVRPIPSEQCTFKPQNFWVTAVLNVITDALILVIPVPMLWKLKVSVRRKLAIAALLSSGLFVIVAAVVRAALTLSGSSSTTNINTWGVRETIVGFITVNIPIMRPLVSRAFWRRGPYVPSSGTATVLDSGRSSRRRSNNLTATATTTTIGSWTPRSRAGTVGGKTAAAPRHLGPFELRAHRSNSSSPGGSGGGGGGEDTPPAPEDKPVVMRGGWPRARSPQPPTTTTTATAATPSRESEEHIMRAADMPRVPSPTATRDVTVTRSYLVQRMAASQHEAEEGGGGDDDDDDDGDDDADSLWNWERRWRGRATASSSQV